jgi:hypothetical protein
LIFCAPFRVRGQRRKSIKPYTGLPIVILDYYICIGNKKTGNMKRILVAAILLFFVYQLSHSQEVWKRKRYEFITGIGTSHFFGDIGGYSQGENVLGLKDIIIYQTRFNVSAGLRYKILPSVSARLSLSYAMFHATDQTGSNEDRGLESNTSAFETSLMGEYYFIRNIKDNSYLYNKRRRSNFRKAIESIDLYAFTGIGGLAFGVKGNDALVEQGMTDGGFTAVIPVGIGVNFSNNPDYSLGVELGGRYSFSDYLDGYSPQYSNSNDVYYFLSFTFTWKIPTSGKGWPLFLSKRKY